MPASGKAFQERARAAMKSGGHLVAGFFGRGLRAARRGSEMESLLAPALLRQLWPRMRCLRARRVPLMKGCFYEVLWSGRAGGCTKLQRMCYFRLLAMNGSVIWRGMRDEAGVLFCRCGWMRPKLWGVEAVFLWSEKALPLKGGGRQHGVWVRSLTQQTRYVARHFRRKGKRHGRSAGDWEAQA